MALTCTVACGRFKGPSAVKGPFEVGGSGGRFFCSCASRSAVCFLRSYRVERVHDGESMVHSKTARPSRWNRH